MNTIPSIFNERVISYTVLGGKKSDKTPVIPVTCVVFLRNGRHFRNRVFENLAAKGFSEIISAEPNSGKTVTEQLSRQFPHVKFLVANEDVTQGDLLNVAMAEAKTKYVLVVQEEMCAEKISFSQSLCERLMNQKKFCICPRLFNSSFQKVPVAFYPAAQKTNFYVESSQSFADGEATLYPADLAGLYDREKFIFLGGMDYTISSPYWQKLDLFFRAWLWGETVNLCSTFDFSYTGDVPLEDRTADLSYLKFYLKNLLPVFENDHARIHNSSFLSFKSRSSCGFVEAMDQFNDASRWTKLNQYRFKMDAPMLIENWGNSVAGNSDSESSAEKTEENK